MQARGFCGFLVVSKVLGGASACWNWWLKVLAVHALGLGIKSWGFGVLRLWDAFGSGSYTSGLWRCFSFYGRCLGQWTGGSVHARGGVHRAWEHGRWREQGRGGFGWVGGWVEWVHVYIYICKQME